MKTSFAIVVCAVVLLIGGVAGAEALPGQGQSCTAATGCSGKLRCGMSDEDMDYKRPSH